MAERESRGTGEKLLYWNKWVDAGTVVYGYLAGKVGFVLLGLGGLIAGKLAGDWLKNRRQKAYA